MDYIHANSSGITSPVLEVLLFLVDKPRLTLDRSVEELGIAERIG